MSLQLKLDEVYVIGAAGYWLERGANGENKRHREELAAQRDHIARLRLKLIHKNALEIKRRTEALTKAASA